MSGYGMYVLGIIRSAARGIPGEAPDARLHAMLLFREQKMIVLPPNHALARKKSIPLKDFHGERYLNGTNCEFNGYADQF
jgi:DNA-binding transcriptional LysR family regulator